MNDYTNRDQKNYGDPDIGKTAYPKFIEKLEICQDIFYGFDYSNFQNGSDYDRSQLIKGGVNFITNSDKEKIKKTFIKEALLLHHSLTLCRSLLTTEERFMAAFFETVRTILTRVADNGRLSLKEINARINELLKHSIKSHGIINLFSDIQEDFSLFDPKFLDEISKMKEKNLAVELLKKLLAEQIVIYQRTNVIQSDRFSELLSKAMSNYLKGLLTNEEVIEELLKMAKEIIHGQRDGVEMGLTLEEKAFYDALTQPEAVKDFYQNTELIDLTKELTDILRSNKTIDWQKKESARAGMRRLVKRLLKKYKYPPEGVADALNTVIKQCEMWSDNI